MTRHEQAPWIVGDGEPTDEVPIASPEVGDAERARVDVFESAFAAYCDVDRIARTTAEALEVAA